MSTKALEEAFKVLDVLGQKVPVVQIIVATARAELEQIRQASVSLYAKVLLPPGPEETPDLAVLYSIALEAAPVLGMRACPKCNAVSGDDWRQCGGSCPRPDSPHYQRENGGVA